MEKTQIYIYEADDGSVGASIEYPEEQPTTVFVIEMAKKQVLEILENGNMTIPLREMQKYREKEYRKNQ